MDVQGQPQLQKELGVSLGYMRPCVKKKLKTKENQVVCELGPVLGFGAGIGQKEQIPRCTEHQ